MISEAKSLRPFKLELKKLRFIARCGMIGESLQQSTVFVVTPRSFSALYYYELSDLSGGLSIQGSQYYDP
jgi:hypothetical protein